MSYGTKYRFSFVNLAGQSVQVDLKLNGYSSTITTRTNVANNPVSILWECEDPEDPFCPVFKSSCITRWVIANAGETLREIVTAAEKEYMIEVKIDSAVNFKGYVKTGYYSESFTSGYPLVVEILASDGLSELGNKDFLNSSGYRWTGETNYLTIILNMLNNVNEASSLRFYNQLLEDTMTDSTSTSMLEQTYIDVERFYSDEDSTPWTCGEVLEAILRSIGSRLFMTGGEWSIVRISEYTGSSVPYVKYTSAGAYSSNGTTTLKSNITSATTAKASRIVPINDNGVLSMEAAPPRVIQRIDTGVKTTLITYGRFIDWIDDNSPLGWTLSITNVITKVDGEESGYACSIPAQTAGDYIFTSMSKLDIHEVIGPGGHGGTLKMKYRNSGATNITFSIRVYVQVGAGYYLDSYGSFGTTPVNIQFTSVAPSDTFQEYTLDFDPCAGGYDFTKVYIYPQSSGGPLIVDDITMEQTWTTNESKPQESVDTIEVVSIQNSKEDYLYDLALVAFVSATLKSYASTRAWLRNSTGNTSLTGWGIKGGTKAVPLQDMIMDDVVEQLEDARFKLSCEFEGVIAASKLLVDTSDSNRCYLPMRLEYNVMDREWDGDWIEIV